MISNAHNSRHTIINDDDDFKTSSDFFDYYMENKLIEDDDEVYSTSLNDINSNVELQNGNSSLILTPDNNTPYDYFRLILTDNFIKFLISNKIGDKCLSYKSNELLAAIGLYLHTGTIKMNNVDDYWTTNNYFNGLLETCFPSIMSFGRFLTIMKSLFSSSDNKKNLDVLKTVLNFYNNRMCAVFKPTDPLVHITGYCPYLTSSQNLDMLIDQNGIPVKYYIGGKENPKLCDFKLGPAIQWETSPSTEEQNLLNKDKINQIFSYYPIHIDTLSSVQRIGCHVFQLILISSYYLYNMQQKDKLNLHEYRLHVIKSLTGLDIPRLVVPKFKINGHFPIINTINRNVRGKIIKTKSCLKCVLCAKNGKIKLSSFHCSGCSINRKIGLCLECFQDYHVFNYL